MIRQNKFKINHYLILCIISKHSFPDQNLPRDPGSMVTEQRQGPPTTHSSPRHWNPLGRVTDQHRVFPHHFLCSLSELRGKILHNILAYQKPLFNLCCTKYFNIPLGISISQTGPLCSYWHLLYYAIKTQLTPPPVLILMSVTQTKELNRNIR